MKISILHYAAPPIIGGVESTIFHHSRLLTQHGYEVEVIAGRGSAFHERVKFHTVPEFDSRHPEIIEVGQSLAKGKITHQFTILRDKLLKSLDTLLSDNSICIVHNIITLHKNLPLTAALFDYINRGDIMVIAWCHDFAWQDQLYIPELHPGFPWDLLRTPWPNVKYVAVSSHRQKTLADLLGLSEDDIEVIPPGVDYERFFKLEPFTRRLIDDLNLLDAKPLFILPARITRRKNIEFALKVIAEVKNVFPDILLIITGPPGPHNPKNIAYLNQLREERARLGIVKNVQFLYEKTSDDILAVISDEVIADFYMLADGLLFPSLSEGFGIPILEAALARIEIFASDIPPIRESSQGLAILFDAEDDPRETARRICDALTHNRAYQLRRHVMDNYAWRSIVTRKIIPLLKEITMIR